MPTPTTDSTTPAPDAACPYCGLDKYEHPGFDFERCTRKPAATVLHQFQKTMQALQHGTHQEFEQARTDMTNVCNQADALASRVAELEAALRAIKYEAGNPNPVQACQNIEFEADAALNGAK